MARRQWGITGNPGCVVLEQITSEGVEGKRRVSVRLLMRDVLHLVNDTRRMSGRYTNCPHVLGDVIAAVTGVAGHSCATDVSAVAVMTGITELREHTNGTTSQVVMKASFTAAEKAAFPGIEALTGTVYGTEGTFSPLMTTTHSDITFA